MNARRLAFGLFTLAMVAVLVGLGVWQLQRRAEKHRLVAALDERLAVTPGALPPPWLSMPMVDERRAPRDCLMKLATSLSNDAIARAG